MNRLSRPQRGASMAELLIALPMFVLFIFIIAELGLMYQAKSVLDMAALGAARMGAVKGGSMAAMQSAAALGLSPLYANGTGAAALEEGAARAKADGFSWQPVGSTSLSHPPSGPMFNGAGGGWQSVVQVDILSPTQQMMGNFGVRRADGAGNMGNEKVIPNDNLSYREAKLINEVNVQDANLLKIKVTYLYEMKMPLTRYFFTPLMNANLTRVLFRGEPVGDMADLGWRVPLVSYATVRMQSDFKQSSFLPAGAGGGGVAPPPGGWPDGSGGSGGSDGSGGADGSDGSGDSSNPGDSNCGGIP